MSQNTKIQINSLAALERLIGGDTALELELRSSVAAAFAEKHLKNLVRETADAGLTDSVRELLDREMLVSVPRPGRGLWSDHTIKVLKPEVRAYLAQTLDELIKEQTRVLLHTAYAQLDDLVKKGFERLTNEVMADLKPRIAESVITQKVREKLASL